MECEDFTFLFFFFFRKECVRKRIDGTVQPENWFMGGKEIHKTCDIVRILQMKLLPLIIQSTVNGYAFRVTRQAQFSTICFVQTSKHIIIFSLNRLERHCLCAFQ